MCILPGHKLVVCFLLKGTWNCKFYCTKRSDCHNFILFASPLFQNSQFTNTVNSLSSNRWLNLFVIDFASYIMKMLQLSNQISVNLVALVSRHIFPIDGGFSPDDGWAQFAFFPAQLFTGVQFKIQTNESVSERLHNLSRRPYPAVQTGRPQSVSSFIRNSPIEINNNSVMWDRTRLFARHIYLKRSYKNSKIMIINKNNSD